MIKTLLFKDAVPSGAVLHRSLQDGGSLTPATTSTGWNTGQLVAGQQHIQVGGTEVGRADSGWTSSALPSSGPSQTIGDCWRTEQAYTGSFASGNWVFVFGIRGVSTASNTGRFRFRVKVYRSTDPNGTGAVDLTSSATLVSATTSSNLSNSSDQSLSLTWSPGTAIPLTAEYLFFQVALEIVTAGSNNNQDVDFRVSNYGITTPDFSIQLASRLLTTAITAPSISQALTSALASSSLTTGLIADSGSTRVYLSWAQLTIPQPGSGDTTVALDGAQGLSAAEAGDVSPGKRVYLSWAQLRLPQTDNILLGIDQHIASFAGELTPFSGDFAQLDGHSVVAEVGTILPGREIALSSQLLSSAAGSVFGAEETYVFTGTMTPALAIDPDPLHRQMSTGYGAMTVDITDPLGLTVPLLGTPMASGSTFGGTAESVQLATRLATSAAGTVTPFTFYSAALTGNEASILSAEGTLDAPAVTVSVQLVGVGMTIPDVNDKYRFLGLDIEAGTTLQADPNCAVVISDRSISIVAGSDTDVSLGGRPATQVLLGEIAAVSDAVLGVPEMGAAAGTLEAIIIATEQSWQKLPPATTIWTDVK